MSREEVMQREKDQLNESAYRARNREVLRLKSAEYYRKNRSKCIAAVMRYERNNPGKTAEKKKRWASENKFLYAEITARKLAERLNAIPGWANEFVIKEFYELAFLRTKSTGVKHHVDHIVPMRSEMVCGLHCEANLRVVTAFENISKRNRYWPDMPELPAFAARVPEERHKGCYFQPKQNVWRVNVYINKKVKHIGYFKDFEEAKSAYLLAIAA